MNLVTQLLQGNDFTPSEKYIVQYIIDHIDDISELSITEFAKQTSSSNPVIIRLCRKLDCDGFKDFKVKLSRDLEKYRQSKTEVDVNYPFRQYSNASEIANSMSLLTKNTIDTVYQEIDPKEIYKISKIIYASDKVYLYGTGDSYIRGISFKNKLLKIGKNINNASFLGEETCYSTHSTPNDCALFVSYSGSSKHYDLYARQLKANHTKIILITATPKSPLAKLSDYVITIPDLENPLDNIATFYSQIAFDYVLNILYSMIYSLYYEQNKLKKSKLNSLNGRIFQKSNKKN